MKIQEASKQAMIQRFQNMESGSSQAPTHAEELAASLQQLLLDEDSDDHKLLIQVFGFSFAMYLHFSNSSLAVFEGHKQESSS